MTRFSKANVLAHIQNSMDMLVAKHGERIKEGFHGILLMLPGVRRDELMRAWGAWHELQCLLIDIIERDLKGVNDERA